MGRDDCAALHAMLWMMDPPAFDNEDCHPKLLCGEGSSSKDLQPSSDSAILQVNPIPEKKAYYGSLVHDFKPEFEKQAYLESPFSPAPPGNE